MSSVFAKYQPKAFPYKYEGTLHLDRIAGGTPTDPKVAEGWLKSKLGIDKDDQIQEMVAEVMVERNVTAEEAVGIVNINKHLNGFKKDPDKGLYIEGRQLKAAIKEAASVAVAAGKLDGTGWGKTRKNLLGFVAEHIFVVEDRLYLSRDVPTGMQQRFVHTWRGSGIQYEEYVEDVDVNFTIITDFEFDEEKWAMLWLTGERQGLGASRSQGYGVYEVTRWEKVDTASTKRK